MRTELEKKLKDEFEKALLKAGSALPNIEIKNFDFSSLEYSASLVQDIIKKLNSLYSFKEYHFDYYFLVKLIDDPLTKGINLRFLVSGEKVRFYPPFLSVGTILADIKLNKRYGAFLGLYLPYLAVEWDEEENSREIIIGALKEIALEKGLDFQVYCGSPNISDVEDSFAFEVPVKADILEYIV
jgi:hypothetical protein